MLEVYSVAEVYRHKLACVVCGIVHQWKYMLCNDLSIT